MPNAYDFLIVLIYMRAFILCRSSAEITCCSGSPRRLHFRQLAQGQQFSRLKCRVQRAAARTHAGEDTVPSKDLLVDQSANCRRGDKENFIVDRECYYCYTVE